jgi:hypothetical protein
MEFHGPQWLGVFRQSDTVVGWFLTNAATSDSSSDKSEGPAVAGRQIVHRRHSGADTNVKNRRTEVAIL